MAWSYRQDKKDELYSLGHGPTTISEGEVGSGVVDGQQLFDDSHVLSLDAEERYLKDAAGTVHIDWSDPNLTAYHRPIYVYGNSNGTLNPPEDYALILRPSEIGVHYYSTDSAWKVLNPVGMELWWGAPSVTPGETVTFKMIKWSATEDGGSPGTINDASVRFFPNSSNSPYFYLRDDTHAELYVDEVRNYSDDEEKNIDLLNRKLYNPNGTTVAIDYGTNGAVKLPNLPTSDPHVVNQLWNNAGTLKISAGP